MTVTCNKTHFPFMVFRKQEVTSEVSTQKVKVRCVETVLSFHSVCCVVNLLFISSSSSLPHPCLPPSSSLPLSFSPYCCRDRVTVNSTLFWKRTQAESLAARLKKMAVIPTKKVKSKDQLIPLVDTTQVWQGKGMWFGVY